MPSDSRPRPSSSDPERPATAPVEPVPSSAAPAGDTGPDTPPRRYNPRTVAALCYAIPYIVSVAVLVSDRRNHFVRFHASQSIIFFVAIPAIQSLLFVAMIVVGNSVSMGPWLVALGTLFIIGFLALGIGALLFWLRLLADCWAGRATAFPIIGRLAHRLERFMTRAQRETATSPPLRQNSEIL